MKIVLGVDGSKYGSWAAEYVAQIPLGKPMPVMALHALDIEAADRLFGMAGSASVALLL